MKVQLHELRALISEALRKAYDILGVPQGASQDDIKKAYRMKAISLHPDKNLGTDTTQEMMKLNVAFGLLSDPVKRRTYDAMGDKTLGDYALPTSSGYGPPARRSESI